MENVLCNWTGILILLQLFLYHLISEWDRAVEMLLIPFLMFKDDLDTL